MVALIAEKFISFFMGLETIILMIMMVGGIVGICALTFICIVKIPGKMLAVIISAVGNCILMVIVTSSFNNLVEISMVDSKRKQNQQEIENQKLKLEALVRDTQLREKDREILDKQVEIAKKELEVADLTASIRLLQSAQFNIQGFERILELGLLEADLKQILVEKRNLGVVKEADAFVNKNYRLEYLGIISHDIKAKFGIDLKALTLANSSGNQNTVIVGGIAPKFLAASKNIATTEVSEIRRYDMENRNIGSNKVEAISVVSETDPQMLKRSVEIREEIEKNFQQKLSQGFETSYMDESVGKLAENFIRIILLPLNKNIEFTATKVDGALPLMDYIQNEIKTVSDKMKEKNSENKDLLIVLDELEYEKGKIEGTVESEDEGDV